MVLTLSQLLVFVLAISYFFAHASGNNLYSTQTNHADIILVGATGDLAKKYLWKGFFDLFSSYFIKGSWTFSFTGVGTKSHADCWPKLNATIHEVVKCGGSNLCEKDKEHFLKRITYVQSKTDLDYEVLCKEHLKEHTGQNVCYQNQLCQYQRIFYLSVPPFAYENIAKYISAHCRPAKEEGLMKVVLEKPFGHDQKSSILMAQAISQTLNDKEVYRVDHYLGKQAVEQIINFRLTNQQIEQMMNRDSVERIEIVMKETVGVKGRTAFYDQYGVVCDVVQNHLSEILYLLTMDLTNAKGASTTELVMKERLTILKQISPIQSNDVLLGQYEGYAQEIKEEANTNETSTIPTFAAVQVRVESDRWRNVPIILMAGKQMDERVGYARIIFKEGIISPNSKTDCYRNRQLVFHIGHGTLKTPAVVVSKSLPINTNSTLIGWKHTKLVEPKYLHMDGTCFKMFVPESVRDAYSMLIEQLFLGKKENFVTTDSLLASWKVWGNIGDIQKSKQLVIYPKGNKIENLLDFSYNANGLFFNNIDERVSEETKTGVLKHEAITGTIVEIISSLVQAIQKSAIEAATNGKDFHIAFSGGTSPLPLFQHLTQTQTIPWHKVHIWQVDERCSLQENVSNFKSICTSLINQITQLRFENIHPMLTPSYPHEVCWERSAETYEHTIIQVLGSEPSFDFVVLGVGNDGHTASLFPYNTVLAEEERLVSITETSTASPPKRMTLTYKAISKAKNVAVIVSGANKCDILRSLITTNCDNKKKYPICKVVETTLNLTWYITNDAMCT